MKYRKGYKYQLYENELIFTNLYPEKDIITPPISLFKDGRMFIRKNYAWDGASGPTWDTDDSMMPSLFHDAAYQLMRMELLEQKWREPADEWLGQMMMDRRSSNPFLRTLQTVRSKIWVAMVKRFAASSANPKNVRKIYKVV